jgi:hypothetical protein
VGEEVDDDIAKPEDRQGRSDISADGKRPSDPRHASPGRRERYGNGDAESDDERPEGKDERIQPRAQDLGQHRQSRAYRRAEVASQHVAEPREVLPVPALLDAHGLADVLTRRIRRHLAFEKDAEGIAGGKIEDDEYNDAHPQEQEAGDGKLPGEDQPYGTDGGEFHENTVMNSTSISTTETRRHRGKRSD